MTPIAELKRAHRATWAAGDYAAVAELINDVPPRDLLATVGVGPDWVEGDAEDLPFEDERFDVVVSAFGVQFAPRHKVVARELARVCRPGGRQFDSAERYVAFMETHYGPTVKARERLTAEGRWQECRHELLALAERRNETADGSLLMRAEYLVAAGRKAE